MPTQRIGHSHAAELAAERSRHEESGRTVRLGEAGADEPAFEVAGGEPVEVACALEELAGGHTIPSLSRGGR
jgi:hypothetical protein